jgi:hypothetical protein
MWFQLFKLHVISVRKTDALIKEMLFCYNIDQYRVFNKFHISSQLTTKT